MQMTIACSRYFTTYRPLLDDYKCLSMARYIDQVLLRASGRCSAIRCLLPELFYFYMLANSGCVFYCIVRCISDYFLVGTVNLLVDVLICPGTCKRCKKYKCPTMMSVTLVQPRTLSPLSRLLAPRKPGNIQ